MDEFLDKLATITKEEEQRLHFKSILKYLTPQDLKYLLYLIKKDLRINAREKHILEGLHPVAYKAFQMSHDLRDVVNRYGSAGYIFYYYIYLRLDKRICKGLIRINTPIVSCV